MQYVVYYLYSEVLGKYYIGKTSNLDTRLHDHNRGKVSYTSKGIPWELIGYIKCHNTTESTKLEIKLKKAKNKKYVKWYIKENGLLIDK